MVCQSTLYQLCILVPDTTVAKCITERRIQYFGPPLVIIADKEKEFVGAQFKELKNASSILLHIIDARAPAEIPRVFNVWECPNPLARTPVVGSRPTVRPLASDKCDKCLTSHSLCLSVLALCVSSCIQQVFSSSGLTRS